MSNVSNKILLIEDNPGDARLVREMLADVKGVSGVSYNLEHVSTFSAGLDCLSEREVDIILLDLSLPDSRELDDMIDSIKTASSNVPIVIMTGLDDEAIGVTALKKGVQDYLVKGQVDGNVLWRSIRYSIERKLAEDKIHQMAYYDPLTALPNRILFTDRVNLAIAHAHRKKHMLALMFLDLDRFKLVNDTFGHTTGDQLLRIVADRLRDSMREDDTISRIAGDEFTVLLSGIAEAEVAVNIAKKILKALSRPITIYNHEIFITVSIGISIYPNDGINAENLLKNADASMYKAKENGKNTYCFYTADINTAVTTALFRENNLRKAVDRDEFVIYHQPQVHTKTRRIVGTEALVRWQYSKGQILGPTEFIPYAEDTGLIISIDEWVLRNVCLQNRNWQDAGLPFLRMSINISVDTFRQKNLVEIINRLLNEFELDPKCIEIEITEGTTVYNVESAMHQLKRLGNLGISIAVDDFGTGHSSLSYLKDLPINTLKVDRSFIRGLPTDLYDAAIVTAIIGMAKSLNIKVIAEGVETEDQLAFLEQLQCDEIQGYLFSKPVPFEELKEMMTKDDAGYMSVGL